MTAAAKNDVKEPEAGGVVEAVLREALEALERFAATGAESAIDLAGMPLTRDERESLEARLGRGEVEVELDIVGRTQVWETAYAGIWWVRHWGGERMAVELIEVAAIPKILLADRDDARAAAARLRADLVDPHQSAEAGAGND